MDLPSASPSRASSTSASMPPAAPIASRRASSCAKLSSAPAAFVLRRVSPSEWGRSGCLIRSATSASIPPAAAIAERPSPDEGGNQHALREALSEEIREAKAIREALRQAKAIREALREAINKEIREEINKEIREALREAINKEIREALRLGRRPRCTYGGGVAISMQSEVIRVTRLYLWRRCDTWAGSSTAYRRCPG